MSMSLETRSSIATQQVCAQSDEILDGANGMTGYEIVGVTADQNSMVFYLEQPRGKVTATVRIQTPQRIVKTASAYLRAAN